MGFDGLDVVELVAAVEDAFHVRLSDHALARVSTVGGLYLLLLEELGRDEGPRRQEALLLERLRRTLVELFGPQAADVSPMTPLEEVIPRDQRRLHWQRLAAALDLRLPPLRRPAGLTHFLNGTTLGVLALGLVGYLLEHPHGSVNLLLFVGLGLVLVCFLKYRIVHFLTTPWAVCFAEECATVRGLLRWLLLHEYGRLLARDAQWHEDEIWPVLQGTLAKALGVQREKVTPEAHILRDLAAG